MSKFVRVMLIIVCLTCGIGLILMIIGWTNGGWRQCLTWFANGEFSFGEHVTVLDLDNDYSSDYSTHEGDGEDIITQNGMNVSELDFSISSARVIISCSDDESISIKYDNVEKLQYYIENDILYILEEEDHIWSNASTVIHIYLPEELEYERMDIDIGGGTLETGAINVKEAEIELGAGKITMDELNADNLLLEIGAGEVKINAGTIVDAKIEVGMGTATVNGTISGDLDAECAMGTITLNLTGEEEDHNYDIDCSAGSIKIGKENSGGMAVSKKINNGSNSDFVLECAMGSIFVNFNN